MANRLYIGARYIPVPFNNPDGSYNWLPGVAYEGLTIVIYDHRSYISKKPVPAISIPPSEDTDHWVDAYLFNADVAEALLSIEELQETKADKDGVYASLWAGELISKDRQTDNTPYLLRETGGDLKRIAPLAYQTLVGASVAENQLVQSGATSVTVQSGHKYYAKINGTESLGASTGSAITINDSAKDMVVDLTQKLGSAIADYIYSLGSTNGISKLREWGFLRGYQAYNAGSIESVEVTEKKVVGFNQWDELIETGLYNLSGKAGGDSYWRCTNPVKVIPNKTYYIQYPSNVTMYVYGYSDTNFRNGRSLSVTNHTVTIPNDVYYFAFAVQKSQYGTAYNNDICINLSNPDRNGEYEPYKSITYSLGSDVLRGIFKLDANNKLYADGDRKEADGTITRYYGTRAYQEGDESLADAITDGTTTVYKLSTPTIETSTPFTSPQIVYPDGTEEFVTENGVPVGHETEYPYDLIGMVENLINVPDVPSTNGTYKLQAVRTSSGVTYDWVTD